MLWKTFSMLNPKYTLKMKKNRKEKIKMIKDRMITTNDIQWFIDNCVANNEEGFEHLCEDCPIRKECQSYWTDEDED